MGLALTACGTGTALTSEEPADEPAARGTQSASRSAVVSPSRSASSPAAADTTADTTPAATPTAEPARVTLAGRLLTAEDLAAADGTSSGWRVTRTLRTEPAEPVATCQRFAMTSIGAIRAVARTFEPEDGSTDVRAATLVARFPDAKTARRAYAVLGSWHEQCDEQLSGHEHGEVGTLHEVGVSPARASACWYLLRYGPDEAGAEVADAQGMVRVRNKIALVALRSTAQSPTVEDPVAAAVHAAAERLA